jgi:hypothetical protein
VFLIVRASYRSLREIPEIQTHIEVADTKNRRTESSVSDQIDI